MRHGRSAYRLILFALAALMLCASSVWAQRTGQMPRQLDGTGIDEQLGATIPTDLVFTNEDGEQVSLDRYFDGTKPVLLTLIYHNCPMLCNLVLHGTTQALSQMKWTPGEEFDVVAVSFNHRETPAVASEKKAMYVDMLGKPAAAAGWHFLTGTEAAIEQLTSAVGFRYKWVEEKQEYAHPSTLIFLSGEGKVTRYLHGIEYKPQDVRTALVEASNGKVGSAIDQIILYCFQFDPNENSYVLHALNLMKAGGMLTMVLLGSMLFFYWRRETSDSPQQVGA